MSPAWGGLETLRSYGVQSVQEAIETASPACDDAWWLAQLPWWLEVPLAEESTVHVTHIGLPAAPLATCLAWFDDQFQQAMHGPAESQSSLPEGLFLKNLTHTLPTDLRPTDYVVSGHVPQQQALALADGQRWLVDTSGGRAARQLSAVILPQQHVVTG